jgi:hypothetical protein
MMQIVRWLPFKDQRAQATIHAQAQLAVKKTTAFAISRANHAAQEGRAGSCAYRFAC